MKKTLLLILLVFLLCFINNKEENIKVQCKHFTQTLFDENLTKSTKYDLKQKPIAIVVPHNETIMDMTASALASVADYNYDTVIILSVNHQAKKGKMLLSSVDFETAVGTVYGDIDVKEKIKNSLGNNIIEEHEIVCEDHSASIIMPYIKTYMQNVKVVTILFTPKTTINDIKYISEILNSISKEKDILLLGSIDFSHYQTLEDIRKYDEETIELIRNFNIEELKQKDGRNLDSSESIGIILKYAKLKEIQDVNVLEHRIESNKPFSDDYGSYMVISVGG